MPGGVLSADGARGVGQPLSFGARRKLSIFVPAFNAAERLRGVIERIPAEAWQEIVSVWIVDDGSADATGEVAAALSSEYRKVKTVRFPGNRGYGHAVREGLRRCKDDGCDIAVCLHSDGQYPPEHIPAAVELMGAGGFDLLQGSRIASGTALSGGMPVYKYIANRALTFFENLVFGLRMTDYHSGYLFYGRRALEAVPFDTLSGGFEFDLEVIACARARGLSVGELPIPTRYAGEVSHVNSIGYGLRCVGVMSRYLAGKFEIRNPKSEREEQDAANPKQTGGAG